MTSLRGFRKSDLPRLYALDQSCFAPDIAYSEVELKYFLGSARCSCWVAEQDGDLAGFLIVERVWRHGRITGHIVTVDVEPVLRRQGIGCLLLGAAEEEMRREGAAALTLEVAEENAAARAFYGRMGFADTGFLPRYYAGRLDARVMEKVL